MMTRITVSVGVVVGLLLVFGVEARGADYTTCFAFDPVFVQADQRSAPAASAKRARRTAERASADGKARPAPRLSLRALAKALESLVAEDRSPAKDTPRR